MEQRYLAFDVETPNCVNARMSAIGVSVVEDGSIVEEFYTLVNPEVPFDRFNMALTGITPALVADSPTFPELWREIAPMMDGGLLVAHNAPFDMSVLAKCLKGYGIRWRPMVRYACTCQMSRRILPGLPNHKLNTLGSYLKLDLDHHHAGSDSRACGEILLHCLNAGAELSSFVRVYDMEGLHTVSRRERSWNRNDL